MLKEWKKKIKKNNSPKKRLLSFNIIFGTCIPDVSSWAKISVHHYPIATLLMIDYNNEFRILLLEFIYPMEIAVAAHQSFKNLPSFSILQTSALRRSTGDGK